MEFGIRLTEKEYTFLLEFMKKNKIKSKGEAIRRCIEIAVNLESRNDMLFDMNNKLNRIIYRENIQKKLLEQFFANMVFKKNYEVKEDKSLIDFYQENNFYLNKIMD